MGTGLGDTRGLKFSTEKRTEWDALANLVGRRVRVCVVKGESLEEHEGVLTAYNVWGDVWLYRGAGRQRRVGPIHGIELVSPAGALTN